MTIPLINKGVLEPARGRSRTTIGLRISTLWEAFRVAAASLRQNKLRTGLTLIGIIVGVTAVIAVVTIIKGLDQTVASTFSSQGSTVFTISKRPQVITSREDFIKFNRRKDVVRDDAEAVFRSCTACWRTGIAANSFEIAKHGDQKFEGVRLRAVTPLAMFDIDGVTIDSGRLWTEAENSAAREVCVVGPDVVTNLFPDLPLDRAIGQDIWVAGHKYMIVGVLQALGKIFGASRDNVIYIPYANFEKNFGAHNSLVVFVQTQTAPQLELAEDQARAIMRNRRGKTFRDEDDGFALETQDVFLNLYTSATSNIYIVTIGVSAISLVVGGIVVMNIMLVSVTERTKEIGIRKSLGARQIDILKQFLVEAVTLAVLGGAIGILLAWIVGAVVTALIFPTYLSIFAVLGALGASGGAGVASGIFPAWKAARLDPIEALRAD